MATTMYFEETIKDQGGVKEMDLEIGRSSYYPEDSIYIVVDGKGVTMDIKTAKKFVDAVQAVGRYHNLID